MDLVVLTGALWKTQPEKGAAKLFELLVLHTVDACKLKTREIYLGTG